ncbi:MAG: tRNA lysidine(34) synthetase TilS [Oscillospiraceae bacterium]|jgi:tRNA(Ile)-lysidine synthase|nr:tRNA lysidine(34) synthetase TilS [Oscillospiraceae bacterium]
MFLSNIPEPNFETLCGGAISPILCALSGGADSIAMTHLLYKMGYKIFACHVNHGLRGADSDSDEEFCREFCDTYAIPLAVKHVKIIPDKHESTEEAARKMRYNALYDALAETQSYRIATAHNADDNAETILLNLIRGTGLRGLCGIPTERDKIIRPIITNSRAAVEEYIAEHNLRYVTDKTNFTDDYTRNKIRRHILPVIKQINPSFTQNCTGLSERLTKDDNFLDTTADEGYNTLCCYEIGKFSLDPFLNFPEPVQTRIILRLFAENNIISSSLRVAHTLGLLNSRNGKLNLQKNKFLIADGTFFYIKHIPQQYRKH